MKKKKNININLFGTLYAIDEDACILLENYLDNMRSYFAKRDGGDEIFDDIEHCGVRGYERMCTRKKEAEGLSCGFEDMLKGFSSIVYITLICVGNNF